ncbi:SDR family NAD(P)-dependent oxidoreductase [soil metagenome]
MSNGLRALVTGGAGLIGSHIVDLLIDQGWRVRVLDNLERQTHRHGLPPWLSQEAEFMRGDVRHRRDWQRALQDIDVVFHQAAYGGYMPHIAKFIHVNSYGTALMLETIRNDKIPVRKIVLASSQAVYDEGAYHCPTHGRFFGCPRSTERLERGDFAVHCPVCDASSTPVTTSEDAPIGGRNVYAISKFDQERLSMTWGQATGIPVTALRYSCTYGPRQSVFNPYTGVIAIFCTRLVNNLPPVVYEDGKQSRDLIFAGDVARANVLAATDDRCDGQIMNVGAGNAIEIDNLARMLADKLGVAIEPEYPGTFRPGEMRALISDIKKIGAIGFVPQVDLETGISKYLEWIAAQGSIREYFGAAEQVLKKQRIIRQSTSAVRS